MRTTARSEINWSRLSPACSGSVRQAPSYGKSSRRLSPICWMPDAFAWRVASSRERSWKPLRFEPSIEAIDDHRSVSGPQNPYDQCLSLLEITRDQRNKGLGLDARRHAEPTDARKFQRGPPNIKSEHGTKEIDLKTFDP